jgi:glycosyltransferase involved in cell wall biosynthesis
MKIGFLLPRYGPESIGGAELAARAFAERLAARPGIDCDVFTTCAIDAATWRDELATGTSVEAGVSVHRFRSTHGRRSDFGARNAAVLADPGSVAEAAAWEWLAALGPVCPDAVEAAVASNCDVVTVHPALYHPCVTGALALAERCVLHAAAHDEAALHLPIYREVFERAGALSFWSDEERAVVARLFPATVTQRQLVTGFGVDLDDGTATKEIADLPNAIGGRPFVLCLGKVLTAKGCQALALWFRAYKQRHPGDVVLVFAGTVHDPLPADDDVIVLGAVSEAVKARLLGSCALLVSPSPYESLSLVVLEAWAAGKPVLVNGACDVTRGHCERHGGGLWFVDYATFEVALDRLLDPATATVLGSAGREAVRVHFAWPAVLDRYVAFLAGM